MSRILIGVAWPYASGPIHVGHVVGSFLPGDVFARFHRLRGDEVLMVSGSDMHGTPITVKAEEEGTSPEKLAWHYHEIIAKSIKDLGITFDLYLTTEHPTHKEVARDFFETLYEKGHIYLKPMVLPYCPTDQRYLPDRYVEGTCPHCGFEEARGDQCDHGCGKLLDPQELIDPRCSSCGTSPEMREREHFFFRLSGFEDALKEYVRDKDHWRANVLNFTRNWLDSGLKDRPVSRDIDWGIEIPIPGHDDKRIYVWFEAFIGYYSMAVEWARQQGDPEKWREYWQDPSSRTYYFLGKDNIPFHTIFWPAVLMGVGDLNLPYDVPANEYMLLGGAILSKSRGVTVNLNDILQHYPPDALRYYLAARMPETRDSEFSWEDFAARNNNELVAAYGNLVHRVLTFTEKHFGEVPPGSAETDGEVLGDIRRIHSQVTEALGSCHFRDALGGVMSLARFGNRFFDAKAPWALVREDKDACGRVLHASLRLVKALAVLSNPFVPFSSERLWEMLGEPGGMTWDAAVEDVTPGQGLGTIAPLFDKIEAPWEAPEEASLLDVRVAVVDAVEDHPDADRLYVLQVALGEERRQLVAGLKGSYSRDELVGKKIVVLRNLKPARLRGVESRGMLLAAEHDGTVSLLIAPEGSQPGERVLGGPEAPELAFEDFRKLRLVVGQGLEGQVDIGGETVDGELADGRLGIVMVDSEGHATVLRAGEEPVSLDRDVPPGAEVK
jgi:methionyl-tRNA synthetase